MQAGLALLHISCAEAAKTVYDFISDYKQVSNLYILYYRGLPKLLSSPASGSADYIPQMYAFKLFYPPLLNSSCYFFSLSLCKTNLSKSLCIILSGSSVLKSFSPCSPPCTFHRDYFLRKWSKWALLFGTLIINI